MIVMTPQLINPADEVAMTGPITVRRQCTACEISSELAGSEVLCLGADPRDFAGSSLAF